ncbi:MAG: alkaline phosphatase [Verrucomicrobiales bacterium]|nr:alkaline phosphatase [Verrucomicrobiales bacterium]|tara:strand:- start:2658 stop:4193 length:1536 start_codon:yes stop_codon:yes gene_type:complete
MRKLLPILLLSGAMVVRGQHDPQRNASRLIATEDFAKANKELAKANPKERETHFVNMMLALKKDDLKSAVEHAQQALDTRLSFSRLMAGPRELLPKLHATDAYKKWATEYPTPALIHGPMVGSVTDASATFWVRTAEEAEVEIRIGKGRARSRSSKDRDYTTTVRVNGLQPGTEYDYRVYIDGQQAEAENTKFRTYPERGSGGKFKVGFGGGAGFVPQWERMWDNILTFDPVAMFMLGDNVYIDQPEETLTQHYCYYRRQSLPEWRRLVASTAMYSIYDDHDFGMNDCVPGPEIETPKWKRRVWNIFRENWVNPAYGGGEKQPGCWYDTYIGDVHFIFIDGRYYRHRKGKVGKSMLGLVQKQWLKDTLAASKGTFKVIASPVPWTVGIKPGSRDPWDGYPEEREEIFSFIESKKLDGVFLIAADRHRTDLRTTKRDNGYDLFEFESSRLTNRHTHSVVKTEGLIWGYNKTCSFGLMSFNTTRKDPQVKFECVSIDGQVIHDYTLKLSQISN